MNVNPFQPRVLANGLVGAPAISGDGRTVVWNQNVDGNVDIYRYHDGVVDRISSDERQDIHPTVNYDGTVITWNRFSTLDPNDKEGNFDVVVWKQGEETTLASTRANETDPQVSADGKKIAWTSDIDGREAFYRIELHENGETRALTPDNEFNLYPAFAGPERMVWSSFREGGGSDLVLRDQQGTVKPITFDDPQEVRPAPSADGSTIYYSQESPDGDDDLFRLTLEPHGLEPLSAEKNVDEAWPVCTPDGKTVAWTNFDRRGQGDSAATHIYLNDGRGNVQVSEGGGMHTNVSIADDASRLAYLWISDYDLSDRSIVLLERKS